jgi:hypothetical protein
MVVSSVTVLTNSARIRSFPAPEAAATACGQPWGIPQQGATGASGQVSARDLGTLQIASINDAGKLDDVRPALRRADLATARRLARVYRLTPVLGDVAHP